MSIFTPIFKTGTHTDSSGKTRHFSRADLDRTVESYDPKNHEAPLVIGHPNDDSPAYGWVKELKREGDLLLASFNQVPENLKSAVETGRFKKKSAAFYKDGSLRHVGLLGAKPPAVKGLGDAVFKAGDEYRHYEFNENEPGGDAMSEELQKALREKAELEAKLKAAEEGKEKAEAKFSEKENEAKRLQEENSKLNSQFSEHKESAEKAAKKEAEKRREGMFSELIKAGKVVPGEKEKVLAVAEALAGFEELKFSESGKDIRQPAEDIFWGILKDRDTHGLFSEFAQDPGSGAEAEEYDAAKAAAKF